MKRKKFVSMAAVPILAGMLSSFPASAADINPNRSVVSDKATRSFHDVKQNEIAARIAEGRNYINRQNRTAQESSAAYEHFVQAYNMAAAKACQPNEGEADTYRGLAVIAAMNAGWTLLKTESQIWQNNAATRAIQHYNDARNYRAGMAQKGEVFVAAPLMGRLRVADPSLIEQRIAEAYSKIGTAYK